MANKPTYQSLEQRISFLEQELRDKNEKLSLLTSNFENELKLAREKTREREQNIQDITSNFETFFNTIDDFLFVIDEQGNIIHCNSTVEKRLGYTVEELKGLSILSVHPEDRRSETTKVTAEVIAGKLTSFQIPLVTKQGKQIYVETRAKYGVWNGKPAIFGVSKDITKLKLSEEKFSTAFYLNPSACGLCDANTGKYIEVNDAFCEFFGISREEAIGHTVTELQIMTEKIRDEILSKADKLGRIYNIEAELKTTKGDIKRVLLSGQDIHIQDDPYRYIVVHDVTEIQKAKERAEENENKFSIAFHSSPSVSLITNIDTGEILEANEAVEQVAGYSRAEMIRKSAVDMNLWLIDGDRGKFVEMLTRDGKVLNFESTFRKKSGEAFIGLISGQLIQIQNQNCILSIINDITDLKRIENDLIKAKEIAEENERKFSKLLDSCPEPLTVTTIEDGRFIMTNEAFHNATGFSREDTANRKSPELDFWLSAEDRQKWADELIKNGSVRGIEFQMRTKKYGIRDYLISSDIIMLDKKKCAFTFFVDITDRKNNERIIRNSQQRLKEESDALLALMSDGTLFNKDIQHAIKETTEVCSKLIGSERVSVWLYNNDYSSIRCIDLYTKSKKEHTSGERLLSQDFKSYTNSHKKGKVIAAVDVFTDLRTHEIYFSYFQKFNIYSLLDAPVWIHDRLGGLLSFEHTGEQRNWTLEDERLATNMAALVALCFEINERKQTEDELYNKNLEYEALNEDLKQANEEIYERNQELTAAKEKAEKSEQKLKDAQEIAMMGSWDLDMKSGIFTFNDNCFKIFHTTAEEMGGYQMTIENYVKQFVYPEEAALIEEGIKALIESKNPNFTDYIEHRILYNDGSVGYISVKFFLVMDESGTNVKTYGVIQDITNKKIAEQELIKAKEKAEESEKKYKDLFLNMINAFALHEMIFNDNGEPIDYVFLEVNPIWEQVVGIKAETVIGKRIKEIMPKIEQSWIDRYARIVLTGTPDEFIDYNEATQKYYNVFAYKHEGNTFAVFFNDITDKKQAEIELIKAKEKAEENEQKFSLAFHNNPSITIITSVNNGKIIEANEATYRIAGYKPEELIGKSPTELGLWAISDDRDKFRNLLSETKRVLNFETTFRKRSGETFIGLISGEFIQLNNQNYVLSIIHDITVLKNTEFELIKAKEKAEESDHLKTAFLQNMSHEIRTPLNAICGFSSFLGDENLSAGKRKSFIQIIQNSSDQLLSVVSDILMISSLETKQEKIDLSDVCLNDIIIELHTIFQQEAKNRNISIYAKQQLTDNQSEIYTDKTKVTEILSNLLSNSLKFTHTGSIEFGYQLINNELEFYVKDSGIGIKPELHEKIFERFRQADNTIQRNYGGTGLGLSICKGLVELLGGKIWVKSEVGKGSTFYFTIPYKPVNEIDKITSPVKQNAYFKNILIAEDDEYNFAFIEEVLSHFPVKLFHAKDGKQAIEIFKLNPQIDLILMDIKMPVMNGYEAAKIIKSMKPDIPVIAQSAYAMDYERIKYEEIFDDYLSKPIKEDTLIKVFSRFVHAE